VGGWGGHTTQQQLSTTDSYLLANGLHRFCSLSLLPQQRQCVWVDWVQVMTEVQGFLRLLDDVYSTFGLEYSMALSTRPESYLVGGWGAGSTWPPAVGDTHTLGALPAC
jgi:hypothetical protein